MKDNDICISILLDGVISQVSLRQVSLRRSLFMTTVLWIVIKERQKDI